MSNGGFKFLLLADKKPYCSSRCFIVADPNINDRNQWELQLDPPERAAWLYEITDIKDWILHGKPKRQIIFDRSDPKTPFRDLVREEVFREYLRKILSKIPEAYQARRKYALMPAIADEATRKRYKSAVEAAIPDVTVLPEPEMVGEYFRLIKRNLEIKTGENNVSLVVDVGASTANMTLILSRRDGRIVEVDAKGSERDLRLRALRGDSDGHAGRWVDKRLVELSGQSESIDVLREVERAKVKASSSSEKVVLSNSSLIIDRTVLSKVSAELWMELRPLFERLCERLYENQVSSEGASRKSEARRIERGVTGPQNAHRMIDNVLLAGGTSQLPGFEEAMAEILLSDGHRPKMLRVGSGFAVAAAVGGLAHILHTYDPPRLREPEGKKSDLFSAQLESTLPHALVLGIKHKGEREENITVLDPNDPFVDDGGTREINDIPPLAKGAEPKARLVLARSAGMEARRSSSFLPIRVDEAPAKFELSWDPKREIASISSSQVRNTGHLRFDAGRSRSRKEATLDPFPFSKHLPADALAVAAADDIVIDLGMSKIVAVTAERGWVSITDLERVHREGLYSITDAQAENEVNNSSNIVTKNVNQEKNEEIEIISEGGGVLTHRNEHRPLKEISIRRSDTSSQLQPNTHSNWENRVSDTEFSNALTSIRDAFAKENSELLFDDIVVAVLALSVRPIVLLAGPPGCGKSTLVRVIAKIFGKEPSVSFHDVAVQAHWDSDAPLFGEKGELAALLDQPKRAHLVLLDEFNLTRPEYYLSRLFHALENDGSKLSKGKSIGSCRIFGTLNIDESSRPPSPKVVDRCYLMELGQVDFEGRQSTALTMPVEFSHLLGLPKLATNTTTSDERIDGLLEKLQFTVRDKGLRNDLLPSRRVLADISAMLDLHHRLDLQGRKLLDRSDLVDRIIASRVLVKLSGAFEQLEPALSALEDFTHDLEEMPRTQSRLKLARQQAELGFVSPWQ